MTDTKIQRFKITIPIVKTSVKIVKDEDGNEVEERYIEGVASGTELDKHGDRMAPSAIESMAKSLKQHVINLNNEHDTSWSGELGDITKLTISDNDDLEIKSKLNEMSSAKDLWYAITGQNKKLGLSIGGYVKDYEMIKEGEGDDAKWIRLYKKIDLDHIAVTSSPAYPKSWVSNIAKSVKDNDEKLLKKVKKEKRNKKEKRMRELARAIARSIQELESDLLLELCYKGLKFCSEEQILLLERSLPMKKKNVSLEAKKAKKKADASAKSEGEQDETLATPDNESSKEKSKEDKETKDKSGDECAEGESAKKNPAKGSKPKDKPEESESDEEESEGESDKEEGEDKGEEGDKSPESDEETESEEDEEESSEEESEEKSTKGDKGELVKAVKGLSKGLKKVLESNETLAKRVAELEGEPAGRKTVEIKKTLGDEDGEAKSAEELTKERNKKIEAVRKEFANDPNLFARVQRIRADYAQKAQE